MKIFVDNDVILDILMARTDFKHSQRLLALVEQKKLSAYTSPIIFTNTFYILSKLEDRSKAWSALKKIRLLLSIFDVTTEIIDLALASGFNDFEDAVQYYSALKGGASYIITRNKQDYVEHQIPILTPQEFLAIAQLE